MTDEINQQFAQWSKDMGLGRSNIDDHDQMIASLDARLRSKGIDTQQVACSPKYWKQLSIQKDLESRSFNWVNSKPISKEEITKRDNLRVNLRKLEKKLPKVVSSKEKSDIEGEIAFIKRQLGVGTLTLDSCIRLMTTEKSLIQQHSIPEEHITKSVVALTDTPPIDYNDQLLEDNEPTTSPTIDLEDESILGQIINLVPNKEYDSYSQAQLINISSKITKYGKLATNEDGNTYLGRNISRLPLRTFGAIGCYNVDSLPLSIVKCKGTTVTCMDTKGYEFQGVQTMSRRFISKVLYMWSYVVNLRGNSGTANYRRALDLCSITMKPEQLFPHKDDQFQSYLSVLDTDNLNARQLNEMSNGEYIVRLLRGREYKMVSGELSISLIKDLLFLVRNQQLTSKKVAQQVVSPNLYNVIKDRQLKTRETFETILNDIKGRLMHVKQIGENAWGFSSLHPEYLLGLLKELRSGNYQTDMLLPAIVNLYKYPIECKDTHVKQMTEKQHEKNGHDYNQYVYIWDEQGN
jgi:hypothetical protein